MIFNDYEFVPFSADCQRIIANLEQSYVHWLDCTRTLRALPSSMYWSERQSSDGRVDYLYSKASSSASGRSLGARTPETEAVLAQYADAKEKASKRLSNITAQLSERVALYRRLHLPWLPDQQAAILRELDIEELLGSDLMVVGTNAFVAYQQVAGAFFPTGNEETEDFDLAWCRGHKMALTTSTAVESKKNLLTVLRGIDASYAINPKKPYQAINDAGYEVELLAAPSAHPLPKTESFDPMASLVEQEWLLLGRPVQAVVATQKGKFCALTVPDPRWMGLHKLWLADKPERKESKREKDKRQGNVLLDAVRYFMQTSHPIDVNFVLSLPSELQGVFDTWCGERHFIPNP
jgi:hypothetical protein